MAIKLPSILLKLSKKIELLKVDELGGARQDIRLAFRHLKPKMIFLVIVFLAILFYLVSGIYIVQPGESAVVRTFGRMSAKDVSEGIHYRLPWPIDRVDIVNIAEVKREIIGLPTVEPDHPNHPEGSKKIQVLSSDTNIIEYVVVVQYRIKDASTYLFNNGSAPYQLVRDASRASVTRRSAEIGVDDILTSKRQSMASDIKSDVQYMLDKYTSGILVVGVNFQKAYPPDEVADAFQDVQSAKEDKEKMINQAIGYQNSILPEARGTAQRSIIDANAYARATVDTASGESISFSKILAQYQKDSFAYGEEVTRYRLYIEKMEKIINRVKTFIVNNGNKIDLRMIDTGNKLETIKNGENKK